MDAPTHTTSPHRWIQAQTVSVRAQLDWYTDPKHPGLGLELSVMRRLIDPSEFISRMYQRKARPKLPHR